MTKCQKCGVENSASSAFCENCGKALPRAGDGPALQTLSELQTKWEDPPSPSPQNKDQQALEPGAIFAGRYTIESVIGSGGMGIVYRAKDRIGDRDVALKLIRSDRLGGDSAVKRLISEGVLTQDIRHKNVVGVYHVDEWAGQPFMSMELINGVSLREWHRKQVNARADVPATVAARIINEILHGLQAAHDLGVIHRDLKPENVMLTGEPTGEAAPLKLLDFGIARAGGKIAESGTGTGLGTPRYMAPEQITNPDSAGPAADFYSLSTIFYELLVGVLPQGGWQPPSSGRSDVPAGVDALIQSGLQNRPASRPQSVAEYRQKLNAAFGGASIIVNDGGGDAPLRDDAARRAKQRKWLKIGGGVVAGIVVFGAIGNLIDGNGEPDIIHDDFNLMNNDGPTDEFGTDTKDASDQTLTVDEDTTDGTASRPSYARLGGRWLYEMGYVDVVMGRDGQFSGNGSAADGTSFTMSGRLGGLSGNYTISGAGVSLPGQLSWDGRDCHLSYRTLRPDGQIMLEGLFHIDHPVTPGAPCPQRWSAGTAQ